MRLQPSARQKLSARQLIALAGLGLLGLAMLTLVDFSIGKALYSLGSLLKGDLYYLFRIWGSLWPWLLFSIALALSCRGKAQPNRAKQSAFILLSPALSGGLAEILKLTFRRERPSELGAYVFRSLSDRPWSSSGLGLPSSHAAVAFGGSMALMILFPRLRWPALVMAVGCALTRVIIGAHYTTDIYLGALVGSVTGLLLAHWLKIPSLRFGHAQPSPNQP
jgi:membrane-associated phospholipid phosphatase